MTLGDFAQIVAFGVCSLIAIAGGLGMATTMSMFRSGIFLMASFIGVAGLFILLSADLLSLLQVMMYIGGMLVMILFMVLFSHDPGGSMMAGMEMSPVERLFSLGIESMEMEHQEGDEGDETHQSDRNGDQQGEMDMQHQASEMHHNQDGDGMDRSQEHQDGDMHHNQDGDDMDMSGMSMVTPIRPLATVLACLIGIFLVALLLLRPVWQISSAMPNPDSAKMVGSLLMGKYMMAFEGAGLLILTGIFGAVLLSRPGSHPSEKHREARVEMDSPPAPIVEDELIQSSR